MASGLDEARAVLWGERAYVVGNACARDDRRKLWTVTGNES